MEFSPLDREGFQVCWDELSELDPAGLLLVLRDKGGFHKAKSLRVSANVILIPIPALNPEINPIERVWQYLKDKLAWEIFPSLDALKEEVSERIQVISSVTLRSLTSQEYILQAVNAL